MVFKSISNNPLGTNSLKRRTPAPSWGLWRWRVGLSSALLSKPNVLFLKTNWKRTLASLVNKCLPEHDGDTVSQISKNLLDKTSNLDVRSVALILIPEKGTIHSIINKKRKKDSVPRVNPSSFPLQHLYNHSRVKTGRTLLKWSEQGKASLWG